MRTSERSRLSGVEAVSEYLLSASWSAEIRQQHLCGADGPVAQLEEKLRRFYGMKHALCVSNATTGLFALALAAGLRRSEFVTTPFTYGATVAGWLLLGGRPKFADIDPHTLSLDCDSVRRVITPKTKALLAVDVLGIPSDTKALRALSDEYGIWYFADASQSLGAMRDGIPASSLADALVVSFTAGKTLFAGEGGAILTSNSALYEKLIFYTQHPSRQRRELGLSLDNELAFNARMAPTSAAWANATFESSLRRLRRHQRKCFQVIDALNDIGLTAPITFKTDNIKPSFFRLTCALKREPRVPSTLLRELHSRNLPLTLENLPLRLIHHQPAFRAQYPQYVQKAPSCPQAERQTSIRRLLTEVRAARV